MSDEIRSDSLDYLMELVASSQQLYKMDDEENKKIATFLFQYSMTTEEVFAIKPESLPKLLNIDEKHPKLPGFPGTQLKAMNTLSNELLNITNSFQEVCSKVKAQSLYLQQFPGKTRLEEFKTLHRTQSELIKNYSGLLKTVDKVSTKTGITQNTKKLRDLVSKKGKLSEKQQNELRSLHKSIVSVDLDEGEKRENLNYLASSLEEQFSKTFKSILDLHNERNNTFVESLGSIAASLSKLSATIRNSGQMLNNAANTISFTSDMKDFAESCKLARYDIEPQPFLEMAVPLPLKEPRVHEIVYEPEIGDPIGLCYVISSYTGTGPNELSATEGQYLLYLERPTEDWVYLQNPLTQKAGFYPTSHVKPCGDAFGIVHRAPRPDDMREPVDLREGVYVAVITHPTDKNIVTIRTTRGELSRNVAKSLIGITHSY